jgi:D-alanyl-D-alanine dipeptidase
MRQTVLRSASLAVIGATICAGAAEAKRCPRVLDRATQLLIVTVPNMSTTAAHMRTYERSSPAAPWQAKSGPEAAVVGARGIGWGARFAHLRKDKEPLKQEGDMRTPAGIYRLAESFGFEKGANDGHMQLKPGMNFCVEDVKSPYYGMIVKREAIEKKTSGEDMSVVPQMKRGLVIDYPPRRFSKAGSCIFLHVWRGGGVGTAGCVALPEERVKFLQSWATSRHTVIAILEEGAFPRFQGCLPSPDGPVSTKLPDAPQPDPRRVAGAPR